MPCVYTNADVISIRSGKGNILIIAFCYMVILSFGCYFIADSDGIVSLARMWWGELAVGTIFCARWCVAVLRQFELTSDGVQISFLRWKRYYCWSELSVYYESGKDRLYLRAPYDGAVILAQKGHPRKPGFIQPTVYCILFHPYTFVFIHFSEESLYPDSPGIYSIHKQEFISKMAAWNLIGTDFAGG